MLCSVAHISNFKILQNLLQISFYRPFWGTRHKPKCEDDETKATKKLNGSEQNTGNNSTEILFGGEEVVRSFCVRRGLETHELELEQ